MLTILTLGDETLYKKCSLVADIDRGITDFTSVMIDTMLENKGIGLAAPQVGDLKKIFVCRAPGDKPRVFVNPEIIRTSEIQGPYEEGCLSIPGVWSDVIRPLEITIQAWNESGKPFTIDADGILARIILHEMDHLKGVLLIDHLNEKKRSRIIKTFEKKRKK